MSGEPQLDRFVGRRVKAVEMIPGGEHAANWQIVLDGDIKISNHDGRRDVKPEGIVGKKLIMVIVNELDTRLIFANEKKWEDETSVILDRQEVALTSAHHAISDPDYAKGKRHYPLREHTFDQTPPDIPAEPQEDENAD